MEYGHIFGIPKIGISFLNTLLSTQEYTISSAYFLISDKLAFCYYTIGSKYS